MSWSITRRLIEFIERPLMSSHGDPIPAPPVRRALPARPMKSGDSRFRTALFILGAIRETKVSAPLKVRTYWTPAAQWQASGRGSSNHGGNWSHGGSGRTRPDHVIDCAFWDRRIDHSRQPRLLPRSTAKHRLPSHAAHRSVGAVRDAELRVALGEVTHFINCGCGACARALHGANAVRR
jgi:hypothetical protein